MTREDDPRFLARIRSRNEALGGEEVHWRTVCEFFEDIEGAGLPSELGERSLDQLQRVIGFDHGLFVMTDRDEPLDIQTFIPRHEPSGFWRQYLEHFAPLDPITSNLTSLPTVFSFDTLEMGETEFPRDFRTAMGNRQALNLCSLSEPESSGMIIILYREGGPAFEPGDLAFVKALYPRLRKRMLRLADPEIERSKSLASLLLAAGLSRRESEVAALLLERLEAGEIADRLFISRRTVEKHVERIHSRLGTRGRLALHERLRRELLVLNPEGWATRASVPDSGVAGRP